MFEQSVPFCRGHFFGKLTLIIDSSLSAKKLFRPPGNCLYVCRGKRGRIRRKGEKERGSENKSKRKNEGSKQKRKRDRQREVLEK